MFCKGCHIGPKVNCGIDKEYRPGCPCNICIIKIICKEKCISRQMYFLKGTNLFIIYNKGDRK